MRKKRILFFGVLLIGIVFTVSSKSFQNFYFTLAKKVQLLTTNNDSEPVKENLLFNKIGSTKNIALSNYLAPTASFLPLAAPTDCSSNGILQNDTIICPGSTITLKANPNLLKDTVPAGFWKQLVSASNVDALNFNIKPFGYDKERQIIYSILNGKVYAFRVGNNIDSLNRVDTINTVNWPGDKNEQFVFDSLNNKIFLWRSGRDSVFAVDLDDINKVWTNAGNSNVAIDNRNFLSSPFWNGFTNGPAIYGGFDGSQIKNTIFNYNTITNTWPSSPQRPNNSDLNPPRGGQVIGANADGKKIYIFSGYGNDIGFPMDGQLPAGAPYGLVQGTFAWLRHLWEIDLTNNAFTPRKLLDTSHPSIQYEGAVTYDYDKNRFYLFGGFVPTDDFLFNEVAPTTNKSFRYKVGVDSGFVEYSNAGNTPPPANLPNQNGVAYYDAKDKKVIWARNDGIWAYFPDSTTIIKQPRTVSWINLNTGNTISTNEEVSVTPTTTTKYQLIVTNYGVQCFDTVTITVDSIPRKLPLRDTICGANTYLLTASDSLIQSYEWHKVGVPGIFSQNDSIIINNPATITAITDTFFVKLKSINNVVCTRTDTVILTFYPPLNLNATAERSLICVGESNRVFNVTPKLPNVQYAWYNGNVGTPVLSNDTTFSFANATLLQSGNFIITANYLNSFCSIQRDTVSVLVSDSISINLKSNAINGVIPVCSNSPEVLNPGAFPPNPNYIYSWTNGGNTPEIANSITYTVPTGQSGPYVVNVRNNASTCTGRDSVFVQFFAPINIDLVSSKSAISDTVSICNGDTLRMYLKNLKQQNVIYNWTQLTNSGQIPFNTSIDTTFTIPNNLAPGTYRYILSGSYPSGCANSPSDTITINVSPVPSITFAASSGIINNTNDSLFVCGNTVLLQSVTNLTGLAYTWNQPDTPPSDSILAITNSSGRYTVSVSNGLCTVQDSIVVTFIPPLTPITPISDTTICSNGQATLIVSNPQLNVQYNWSLLGGNSLFSGTNFTTPANLTPGIYTYIVSGSNTSNNVCGIVSDTVIVTVAAIPTVTITYNGNPIINNTLSLCNVASANLVATSNVSTNFSWNTLPSPTLSNTLNVTNGGNYTVTVSNGSCSVLDSVLVNLSTNAAPTVGAITGSNSICVTGTSQLSSTTPGGVWSSSNASVATVSTTGIVTGVSAGNATISYTVTNSCNVSAFQTLPITVSTNAAISTLPTIINACVGSTAQLNAGANDPSISYVWNTGETTNSINVTQPGVYEVTINNGCSSINRSVSVQFVAAPIVNLPTVVEACIGSSVNLDPGTVVNGTTYTWSNGATTPSISVTAAGTYTLIAENACSTVQKSTTVTFSNPIVINLPPTTTICSNSNATISAGNQSVGTTYLWNTGATTASITTNIPNLYTVTATNVCGFVSASTNLVVNPIPVVVLPASITECSTNSVLLDAGNVGATYLWSNGATSQTITVNNSGNYSVTVTNGQNCSVTSNPVNVNFVSLPQPTLPATTIACANTIITLDAGVVGVNYLWSNGATTKTINVTNAGNYTVTVSNAVCTSGISATTAVQILPQLTAPTITVVRDSVCSGNSIILSVNPTQAGVNYAWSVSGNPAIIGIGNSINIPSVNQTTTYVVTAVNSALNCGTLSANKVITVVPQLATPIVSTTNNTGVSVTFQWNAVPNATGYLISTDNGVTFRSPTNGSNALSETINGLLPLQTINFSVQAIGTFVCQPSNIASITATTINPIGNLLYVPNSFTPNNDGVNDVFTVYGNTIQSIRLRIYNQLGQEIAFVTDRLRGWDGNHKGTKQPVGVYVYFVEAVLTDGSTQVKKGTFTLLR